MMVMEFQITKTTNHWKLSMHVVFFWDLKSKIPVTKTNHYIVIFGIYRSAMIYSNMANPITHLIQNFDFGTKSYPLTHD